MMVGKMVDKRYGNQLDKGRNWENEVEKFFKNLGYTTKRYTSYDSNGNETFQKIRIKGMEVVHPDLEIEKVKNSIVIKQLVEVKSLGYFIDKYSRFSPKLEKDKYYVSVPQYQFKDYVFLQEQLQIETRIIFVITSPKIPIWRWQNIDYLEETKLPIKNAYFDEKYHYFWEVDWLKKFKDHE